MDSTRFQGILDLTYNKYEIRSQFQPRNFEDFVADKWVSNLGLYIVTENISINSIKTINLTRVTFNNLISYIDRIRQDWEKE